MSQTQTFLNVVILPNDSLRSQAITWSTKLSRDYKTNFTLDQTTYMPHITLYQAAYPATNLDALKIELREIAKRPPFDIELDGFSCLDGFIYYNVTGSAQLTRLHNNVVQALNPFRQGILLPPIADLMANPQTPTHIKTNIKTYGSPNVRNSYVPHLTITRLQDWDKAQEAVNSLTSVRSPLNVHTICLGTMGTDGTVNKILASFPLNKQ
jgi:2'-5' RNA ligase